MTSVRQTLSGLTILLVGTWYSTSSLLLVRDNLQIASIICQVGSVIPSS